ERALKLFSNRLEFRNGPSLVQPFQDLEDRASRISEHPGTGRHVSCHHAPGAHEALIPQFHTRCDATVTAEKNPISYRYIAVDPAMAADLRPTPNLIVVRDIRKREERDEVACPDITTEGTEGCNDCSHSKFNVVTNRCRRMDQINKTAPLGQDRLAKFSFLR